MKTILVLRSSAISAAIYRFNFFPSVVGHLRMNASNFSITGFYSRVKSDVPNFTRAGSHRRRDGSIRLCEDHALLAWLASK